MNAQSDSLAVILKTSPLGFTSGGSTGEHDVVGAPAVFFSSKQTTLPAESSPSARSVPVAQVTLSHQHW